MRRRHDEPGVLMLVENNPVPADPRVWREALALRDAGYRVAIISPKGKIRYRARHERIEGIEVYRYRLPAGSSATSYVVEYAVALVCSCWLSLVVWLRHGFDVLHAANPPDEFFLLGWLFRLVGVRYVYDQHDLTPELFQCLFGQPKGGWRAAVIVRLLRWLERRSYRAADLVIATNESFAERARLQGRRAAEDVVVVRNGPQVLPLLPMHGGDGEAKLGRRYLLAYIGVMGQQDGVALAVRALHHLVHVRGRRDCALVLMGDGSQLQALRALAHQLQLDEYVHFTGWADQETIDRYLGAADVGLVPDPKNGLNEHSTMIKTMEYMAMGVPVVAFDLLETRRSAGGAALYATPNEPEDLARQIEMLLADEDLRRRMGAIGRQRVESELGWEHSRERLVRAYAALLAGGRSAVAVAPGR